MDRDPLEVVGEWQAAASRGDVEGVLALAYESDLGSKGHLSSLERGLARPTIETLRVLAERLGCLPLDLLTFPSDDPRQALIESTRKMPRGALRKLAREAAHPLPARTGPSSLAAEPAKGASRRRRGLG